MVKLIIPANLWTLIFLAWAITPEESARAGNSATAEFTGRIQPLLSRYCYGCHGEKKKGDLDFRVYTTAELAKKDAAVFQKVLENLESGDMPPENKPRPTAAERKQILSWISVTVLGCDCDHPDPGRVTIRRLNRAEYNNTIHDLLGINFKPADDFPTDDIGYGFDNIGDVLSLSPMLLEKYLNAAEKIMDQAIGPDGAANQPPSESYQRIFIRQPGPRTTNAAAREIIGQFARRAYRRPLATVETDRLTALFDLVETDGGNFESGIRLALQAVLVSPNFLFRGELQSAPDNPRAIRLVDEYALASRLSYFLWSSMPDDGLFEQAARGTLKKHLNEEVQRMLRDPRAHALVVNFADQWLQLRGLAMVTPAKEEFPGFNDDLRNDMATETERFFDYIMRENRDVREFIDADYTFMNERLARFYGIPGVTGNDFQRVNLKTTQRGGLMTQASVLTLTSAATRTSPVKRGKWVLQNILGAPPPPAPPNIPPLKEGHDAALLGTMRQRMEQHRADPACANCHARMDPIGFGFENYDAIGAWRANDGKFPVDASGELFSGESFDGAAGLKKILREKKSDQFVRCLSEKMLTFALGRGLENYDRCAVDQITRELARDHYRFSSLILAVVNSAPFQMRRGDAHTLEQASVRK